MLDFFPLPIPVPSKPTMVSSLSKQDGVLTATFDSGEIYSSSIKKEQLTNTDVQFLLTMYQQIFHEYLHNKTDAECLESLHGLAQFLLDETKQKKKAAENRENFQKEVEELAKKYHINLD